MEYIPGSKDSISVARGETMTITVNIRSCEDCRHKDHSGAFTPGGARPICGHHDACSKRYLEYDKYGWQQRVLPSDGAIPNWCPLKHGSTY